MYIKKKKYKKLDVPVSFPKESKPPAMKLIRVDLRSTAQTLEPITVPAKVLAVVKSDNPIHHHHQIMPNFVSG